MKRKVVSIVAALLALLAFSGGSVFAQEQTVTIALMEQNGSGQNGTATLTLSADGTSITVEIDISSNTDLPQPAHIHAGTCANLDPKPFIPLNSVVNGRSTTVVTEQSAMGMGDVGNGQYAINIHKSAAEATTYVSCGDIVAANVVGMPTTGGADNIAPVLAFVGLALVATGTAFRFARRKA